MFTEPIDYLYYNKVSLAILVPLILVFLMCMVDLTRTKYLFRSLFSNSYFYRYPYTSQNKISFYQVLIYIYISVVSAFFLMVLLYDGEYLYQNTFQTFKYTASLSSIYFFTKYLLSEFLYNASNKKSYYKQMFAMETSYLLVLLTIVFFVICYVFLHLNSFNLVRKILLVVAFIIYIFRCILLISNNKNLLTSKILYIILYLCTLEIVPFIYLFKSYTA